MARVYVSIGSNVEPEPHVRSAIRALRAGFGPLIVSPVYRSRAVGFDGDDFLNLVVGFDTARDPGAVQAGLRRIEADNGRVRGAARFAPRTLDLDLLTYGDQVIEAEGLSVPRAEIVRYAFVLRPLADIAATERHPVDGRSYAELWAAFDASGQPLHAIDFDLGA